MNKAGLEEDEHNWREKDIAENDLQALGMEVKWKLGTKVKYKDQTHGTATNVQFNLRIEMKILKW